MVKETIIGMINDFKRINDEEKKQLIDFLVNSDYFEAPLTTDYGYSYKGGLAQYCLDILDNLLTLRHTNCYNKINASDEALTILALFHAISKINYFEEYVKNEKVYSFDGDKYDELGNYYWKSIKKYKVKEAKDRFTMGELGLTSYMIISKFIPLNDEETMAIIHHNCGMDNGHSTRDIFEILNCYPLVALLHCAIMLNNNCQQHKNFGE